MPFALIANGTVVQITDEKFHTHEALTWVDAWDAAVGWTYADGKLTAPKVDAPPADANP